MTAKRDLKILENGVKAYCEQIGLTYTDTYGCNVERLNKALEEQEKKDELLELYREYFNTKGNTDYILDKIKALEEALK